MRRMLRLPTLYSSETTIFMEATRKEYVDCFGPDERLAPSVLLTANGVAPVVARIRPGAPVVEVPLDELRILVRPSEYDELEDKLLKYARWTGEELGTKWKPPEITHGHDVYLHVWRDGILSLTDPPAVDPTCVVSADYMIPLVDRWFDDQAVAPSVSSQWNTVCPDCGAPAYVGFLSIECSSMECRKYRRPS